MSGVGEEEGGGGRGGPPAPDILRPLTDPEADYIPSFERRGMVQSGVFMTVKSTFVQEKKLLRKLIHMKTGRRKVI